MPHIAHPSGIKQEIVDKVVARRGRLHAFPELNPIKTALVVIDLDVGTVTRMRERITDELTNRLNVLATELRTAGGHVAWVTTPIQKATENFSAVFGERAAMYEQESARGDAGKIWPGLTVSQSDILAQKSGHSAFFPGKSDVHEQLQRLQIDSILIAGSQTSVCCEASARDAAELDYKVTLISDLLVTHREDAAEAALATFFRFYGDVRPSRDALKLIGVPR